MGFKVSICFDLNFSIIFWDAHFVLLPFKLFESPDHLEFYMVA